MNDNPVIYIAKRDTFLFLHKLLELLFRCLSRMKSGRHQGTKTTSTRMSVAVARASTELRGSCRGEHSSASCSKTRTRMEAEFEVRPSRIRSSHKLASYRGWQHSWTASIWILEAWTRANLAQSDGKYREHATAPIPLPEVKACGPVVRVVWHCRSFLHVLSRVLTSRNQGKYYVNSRLHATALHLIMSLIMFLGKDDTVVVFRDS